MFSKLLAPNGVVCSWGAEIVALRAIFNGLKGWWGSDRTEVESAFTDHSEGIACRRHEGGQRMVDIVSWTGGVEGGYLRCVED
jgi:hypothetical protein